MKIERFFHIRTGNTGGATVRVVGDTAMLGQVDVQVAQCSRMDPFCKKTGRENATKAVPKVVPLRYLPSELGRAAFQAHKRAKSLLASNLDFSFAIKYFLPKE